MYFFDFLNCSMQSIQNLGLAVISIIAGMILDTRGYLFLEVFFIACVSCKCATWQRLVSSNMWQNVLVYWRRRWQPAPVFLPEESHGEKNLKGPCGLPSMQLQNQT